MIQSNRLSLFRFPLTFRHCVLALLLAVAAFHIGAQESSEGSLPFSNEPAASDEVGSAVSSTDGLKGETTAVTPTSSSTNENALLEDVFESALTAAERGAWTTAFLWLDKAEELAPEDPRIASYRASFSELSALDEAQRSWSEGTPSEVVVDEPGSSNADGEGEEGTAPEGESETEPKFTIDRGSKDPKESPVFTRDSFRGDLSFTLFSIDPISSETVPPWSSTEEFFFASFGADLAYWMPFLRRSLGVNFRSSGYSMPPGNPGIIVNSLDLGLNLRGFLLESKTSRMELGLDFGGSLQSQKTDNNATEYSWALFLGMWISDPLFYHIFNAASLENLLVGGGIRIYSTLTDEDLLDMVNYRLETSFVIHGGYFGVRLEWWDFPYDSGRTNMMNFGLFGGYRF